MEKNRRKKILLIILLIIAISGLSLGFSAFSTVLNIQPNANVKSNKDAFNVVFSSSSTTLETNPIIPIKNQETFTATNAIINNTNNPTISNLSATFIQPGQRVSYTFYAYNSGKYDAYLKSIVYKNVANGTQNKVCTPIGNVNSELVQNACSGIKLKIKVGSTNESNKSLNNITNHKLLKGKFEPVILTIEYEEQATIADGDFSVDFGEISLNYSSLD